MHVRVAFLLLLSFLLLVDVSVILSPSLSLSLSLSFSLALFPRRVRVVTVVSSGEITALRSFGYPDIDRSTMVGS